MKDIIPGGLAQGLSLKDITDHHNKSGKLNPDKLYQFLTQQLNKGIKVELEHTNSQDAAKEIAMDHLFEDPKYYIKLQTIEENCGLPLDGGVKPSTVNRYKKYNGLTKYTPLIKEIVEFISKSLNTPTPKIKFINHPNYTQQHHSFGGYSPSDKQIYVVTHGRNMADTMRSLCHEWVHFQQDMNGRLTENAGEDGDEFENEANSIAGKLMREIGRKHPEIFNHTI